MRNFQNKDKIKRMSEVMNLICILHIFGYCAAAVILALMPIIYVYVPEKYHTGSIPNFWIWLEIPMDVFECVAWINLWKFFNRLNIGHMFDASTVAQLAKAGQWKLIGWVYACAMTLAFYLKSPWSENNLPRPVDHTDALYNDLVLTVAIMIVAWLLREAQTLEEERELTV